MQIKKILKSIVNNFYILVILYHRLRGVKIGWKSKISPFSRIILNGGNIKIGNNVTIHGGAIIDAQGGTISIGDNISINRQCVLYGGGGIEIGNYTLLAIGVKLIAQNHNFKFKNQFIKFQGSSYNGIKVKEDVWLGANVIVLDGVLIERGCVCGAGSVITKNLCEYSINVGNPSKIVGYRQLC